MEKTKPAVLWDEGRRSLSMRVSRWQGYWAGSVGARGPQLVTATWLCWSVQGKCLHDGRY